MAITYDEVWITTGREIKICQDSIRAYEKELKTLESQYSIKPDELFEKLKNNHILESHEARWYSTYLALKREEQRLQELETFLER